MIRAWRLIPLALILLALAASTALPLVASQNQLMLLAGALAAAGGAALLLLSPPVGFAILLIASQFVPLEIGTGTQTGINIVVLLISALTGIWLLDRVVIRGRLLWLRSAPLLPLLLFAASAVFSLLVGQLRWFPVGGAPLRAQLGGLAIFLLSAAVYIVFTQQIHTVTWLKRLTWLFLGVGALFVFCTFYLGWLSSGWMQRISGLFRPGTGGSVFWVWLPVLAFGQVLLNRSLRWPWKAALLVLLAGCLYYRGVTTTEWTSGWVPALVGAAVLLLFVDVRLSALLVTAGLVCLPVFGPDLFDRWIYSTNEYSVVTRLEAARILWEIIQVSPIFGLGPANYYWYTPFYNIMGYYVSFNSHNNYLDLLAQTGFVGLGLFFWFLASAAQQGWRVFQRAQDGFSRAYAAACLAAIPALLTSAMLGDWVIPFTYNIGMSGLRSSFLSFLFLAGLVVLERASSKAAPTSPEAAP